MPIREIARAIEQKDVARLRRLKGIGERTAQKIIATLCGKMEKFALICEAEKQTHPPLTDIQQPVMEVLVHQLGHKFGDARQMIADALERNSLISTPEALFDEVYRGEMDT